MQNYLSDVTARWLLAELVRTTLLVAVLGAAAWLVLRITRVSSPTLHRVCCVAVLAAGWTLVRWPVDVAWYEAPQPPVVAVAAQPVEEPESFTPPIDPKLLSPPPEFGAAMGPPVMVEADVAAPVMPAFEEALDEALDVGRETTRRPEPVAARQPRRGWNFSREQLAVAAWLGGIVVVVGWWLVGYVRFLWQLPRGAEGEPEWQAEFAAAIEGQGRARRVEFRVTESAGPLLCRLPRRTVLLVPRGLWNELDAVERGAILRHELEHLSRGDLWKSLAVRVLALPHWFNPVAWLAVRRFDDAAEWACDRAAMDERPTAYAAMLLRLGELAGTQARFGSAMSNRPLTTRIRRLLTLNGTEDSAMKKACLISLLLVVAPLALVRVNLVAEEPEEKTAQGIEFFVGNSEPETQPAEASTEQPEAKDNLFRDDPAVPVSPGAEDRPSAPERMPVGELGDKKPADDPVKAAQRKMVEMARKTYEAQQAAYQARTVTLDQVFLWSNLRLSSELAIAESREEQVAAAQSHLQRMQSLEAVIRRLFEQGSHGGEANAMYAASYYVADAERRLAEIEAMPELQAKALQSAGNFVTDVGRLAEIEAMPEPQAKTPQPAGNDAMLVAAARGYESTLAAYEAGTATLETVISWSNRWLAADLEFARSREEQLAAARAHFRRIREMHEKIAALYRTGSRGGEAPAMATADYYLADAERRVKEIEEMPQDTLAVSQVQSPALRTPREPELNLLNPKRGGPADPNSNATKQPALVSRRSQGQTTQPEGYADPYGNSPRPTVAEKRPQYYDGKMFGHWRIQLQTDLSPTRRTEAIKAIGEFAAHGHGKEAAQVLFDTMRDYSVWALFEDTPDGHLKGAAVEAALRIPAAERLPAILDALATGNKNQKLFALRIVPLDAAKDEIVPPLAMAVGDADREIVELARAPLSIIDHGNAALIASIRRGLSSTDSKEVHNAVWLARGCPLPLPGQTAIVTEPFPEVLPEALELLDHDDPKIQETTAAALTSSVIGPSQMHYVEALERIASSGEGAAAVNARKILDRVNSQQIDRRR